MADRLDVSPTQGVLLDLQQDLERIRSGHDLLDRKREALLRALMERLEEAERLQEEARRRVAGAREAVEEARVRLGTERLRSVALQPAAHVEAEVRTRSVMGVRVPVVDLDVQRADLPYGLAGTSAVLDEARERWLELVRLLADLVEAVSTVWRLGTELRKTQRRVNALESIIIPRYENTLSYIGQVLEEEDREDVVRAKKVKELRHR